MDRRIFVSGLLAAGASGLAGCASGGSRPRPQAGPLNADGTPILAELMKPGPLGEKSLGNPNAPNTIIEYASLTCPFCRKFHVNVYPRVKKELIDTGKVRWIVREFPIGRSAGTAAIITRCGPPKNYFVLFDKFLTQQKVWVSQEVRPDAIYKVAAQTGMTRQTFDACLSNKELEEGLRTVKQRGRELGVTGTPTFFVNGKKKRGDLPFEELVAMLGPQTT